MMERGFQTAAQFVEGMRTPPCNSIPERYRAKKCRAAARDYVRFCASSDDEVYECSKLWRRLFRCGASLEDIE